MILVQEFFHYLRSPRMLKTIRKQSISDVFQLHIFICFLFFANVLIFGMMGLFVDLESFPSRLDSDDLFSDPFTLTLLAVVAAPLAEELLFRLPLKFPLLALASYFIYTLLLLILIVTTMIYGMIEIDLWKVGVPLGIVSIWLVLILSPRAKRLVSWRYHRAFSLIFYWQAILFGLIHMFNYELDQIAMLYVLPLLVVPQFFIGLGLGFLRTKYGILMAIYTHAVYNGILVGLSQFVDPGVVLF